MDTTGYEKENAYYREIAQFEEVEKIRLSLHGFTSSQFQEKYLEQWKDFTEKNPEYLYPDDLLLPHDRFAWEYKPRLESVASQSYQNVECLLIEARNEHADGLIRHYNQMCQSGSVRQVLAERLMNLAARLEKHTVLQELSGNRHKVQLGTYGIGESEKPEQVGIILALLTHFLEVHEQFLRAEQKIELEVGELKVLNTLAARHQTELDEFRRGSIIGMFGNWEQAIAPERNEHNNLRSKISRYERAKQHRTTPASIKALIIAELARQPELKVQAIQETDLYYGTDADKYQIRLDLIEQVYSDFEAHVKRDLVQLDSTTVIESAATTPAQAKNKRPQAGTPTGSRELGNIDFLFSWKFKTTHCDRLARMVDLCPPDEEFEKINNANSKIWSVVKAIKSGGARGYSSKTEAKLARELGKRYGYTVSNKLSKVSENNELSVNLTHLQHHIKQWKDKGELD